MPQDDFDLDRFVNAQRQDYQRALAEIRGGRKRSHWMWYIFPQLDGLGRSSTARFYGVKGIGEAKAYLAHPILGPRLKESMEAALAVEGRSAEEIFGFPDVLKFRSCATLFSSVPGADPVFEQILQKYYDGKPDEVTIRLVDAP